MSKVIWKPGTFLYPIPVVMVSCGTMKKSNIVTVAWTGILNTDPAVVYISLRKERYSHEIISKTKEFVINLTTKDLVYATDWCGVKSGKDFDKFEEMKLTKEAAKNVKCPCIKESPVSVECKVREVKELGTHDVFIADVLSIDADEKYIDKTGKFDIGKCDLIAYLNGSYYSMDKKLGTFGYSVAKKKNKTKAHTKTSTLKKKIEEKKVDKKKTTSSIKDNTKKKVMNTNSKGTKKNSSKKK